jgi:hypothetical protein
MTRGDDDKVRFTWEGADGALVEADLTLDQAAALQRGEPVAGYGLARHFTLDERIAATRARLESLRAELFAFKAEQIGISFGGADDLAEVLEIWLGEAE